MHQILNEPIRFEPRTFLGMFTETDQSIQTLVWTSDFSGQARIVLCPTASFQGQKHTPLIHRGPSIPLPVVFWFYLAQSPAQCFNCLPFFGRHALIAVRDVICMKQSDWSASFKLCVTSHNTFFASPIFKPHGTKIDRQLTRLFFPLHAKNSLDMRLRQGSVWGITLLRSALLDAKSCTFCSTQLVRYHSSFQTFLFLSHWLVFFSHQH